MSEERMVTAGPGIWRGNWAAGRARTEEDAEQQDELLQRHVSVPGDYQR